MSINTERKIVNNTPYIDTISARQLIHLLYQGGLIELPHLEGDVVNITSCPVNETYNLRRDLPNTLPGEVHSIRTEIGSTDYDTSSEVFDDDAPVLHPRDVMTSRIIIDLGDE